MKQTVGMTDHLNQQKDALKKLRGHLAFSYEIDEEYTVALIEQVNTLIGRINCYLTDDDKELESLAVIDGLRE